MKIKINVIGSGVVGYATGKGFLKRYLDIAFIDVNSVHVEQIKAK